MTLSDIRTQKGLSQRTLAKALELSPSTIAHYETARRTPSLPLARKIADYLGVSLDDLRFEGELRRHGNGR